MTVLLLVTGYLALILAGAAMLAAFLYRVSGRPKPALGAFTYALLLCFPCFLIFSLIGYSLSLLTAGFIFVISFTGIIESYGKVPR